MRDFTHADYCGWNAAFVITESGYPQRVNPFWLTNLGNGDYRIRFALKSGAIEEANLSEGRLKTDGTKKEPTNA